MPIYNFKCSVCGKIFETIMSIDHFVIHEKKGLECVAKNCIGKSYPIISQAPAIVKRHNLRIPKAGGRKTMP